MKVYATKILSLSPLFIRLFFFSFLMRLSFVVVLFLLPFCLRVPFILLLFFYFFLLRLCLRILLLCLRILLLSFLLPSPLFCDLLFLISGFWFAFPPFFYDLVAFIDVRTPCSDDLT